MEDYRNYYQQWTPNTDIEITCYDQLTIEEIILHTIYTEFYYPKVRYIKLTMKKVRKAHSFRCGMDSMILNFK